MANNTTTTLSDQIKTQYERRLLTRALPRLIYGRWGMQARLNKVGAYELRKYGALSAVTSALTEGTTPSEQSAISLTLVTITPSFYGAWLGYTDELDMQSFDPIISEFTSILGEQAGLSADTLVRNALTDGATNKNNLKQNTLADQMYHDVYRVLPMAMFPGYPKAVAWFGEVDYSTNDVDITQGLIYPFVETNAKVFRCPSLDRSNVTLLYNGLSGGYGYNRNLGTAYRRN